MALFTQLGPFDVWFQNAVLSNKDFLKLISFLQLVHLSQKEGSSTVEVKSSTNIEKLYTREWLHCLVFHAWWWRHCLFVDFNRQKKAKKTKTCYLLLLFLVKQSLFQNQRRIRVGYVQNTTCARAHVPGGYYDHFTFPHLFVCPHLIRVPSYVIKIRCHYSHKHSGSLQPNRPMYVKVA